MASAVRGRKPMPSSSTSSFTCAIRSRRSPLIPITPAQAAARGRAGWSATAGMRFSEPSIAEATGPGPDGSSESSFRRSTPAALGRVCRAVEAARPGVGDDAPGHDRRVVARPGCFMVPWPSRLGGGDEHQPASPPRRGRSPLTACRLRSPGLLICVFRWQNSRARDTADLWSRGGRSGGRPLDHLLLAVGQQRAGISGWLTSRA
jgi:hypothetical protein